MNARACVLALLSSGVLAAGAVAQSLPTTVASCTSLLEVVGLRQSSQPDRIIASGPDVCRYEGVHLRMTGQTGYEVGTVTVSGVPQAGIVGQKLAMRVEADDVRFALHTGRAKIDWMNRQQQIPFRLALDFSYDPATMQLVLHDLRMTGEFGAVSADATIDNFPRFDPWHPASAPPPEHARIKAVHVHLANKRFLVAYVLPWLVSQMPDGNPETIVDRAKIVVIGEIRLLLPDAPPDTITAISDFVRDFPHPLHPFDLSLQDGGPGFGEAEAKLVDQGLDAQIARLKQVKVQASYTGEFH